MTKEKEEKEEKPKVKYSAGYWKNGEVYEQISGGKFANGANGDLNESLTDGEYLVFPLNRPAWRLASLAVDAPDPDILYDDIKAFIKEHLYLPCDELYDVLAAWTMASWVPEAWKVVPYLFFYGVLASGKTRGLEVLQRISYRGILSANFSTAALFRASELWHPTVFLDETEVYNQETRLDIIALLNSGYRKGQYVHRLKRTESGHELESFDVFGFKALAGTEGMKDTLESRSILIEMVPAPHPLRRELDEEKALNLRNRLLGFRFTTLQCETVNDVNDVNLFPNYKPLDFGDGRLEELFNCLLRVSSRGEANVREYARKMYGKRRRDKKTSVEAELVEILVSGEVELTEGFVSTKKITEVFNSGRNDKEKWKLSSIGRIMRRLHFEKDHKREGNGFVIDPDRLKYLVEYYEVDYTSGNGSHGSHGSQKPTLDEMLEPQPLNEATPTIKDDSEGAKKAAKKLKELREMK